MSKNFIFGQIELFGFKAIEHFFCISNNMFKRNGIQNFNIYLYYNFMEVKYAKARNGACRPKKFKMAAYSCLHAHA
jgi:hypothetical protein